MFHGSVPADVQAIVLDTVKDWKEKDVYVGCSGNFTIERVLQSAGIPNIHSNDVTIYSCMIGNLLAGNPIELELNSHEYPHFAWMEKYMETPTGRVACMMLCTRLMFAVGRMNPYYDKLVKQYESQFENVHAKTVEKLANVKMKLASFHAEDVFYWVDRAKPEDPVICYPPFFANDYANQFAKLEKLFTWQAVPYEEFNEPRKLEFLEKLMDRKKWMVGLHVRFPQLEPYLSGMAKTTNRGVSIYIYSNAMKGKRVVVPNQKTAPVLIPRLAKDQEIGDKMWIKQLNYAEFATLRSEYMNANICPGQAFASFAVMVDDRMVGCFALGGGQGPGRKQGLEDPAVYILSDFPVAPSKYKRLSKLVLYATLTKEARILIERVSKKRVNSLITTAFSKKPVSMKYRGVYELMDRSQIQKKIAGASDDVNRYYSQGYMINYGALLGQMTMKEALELWKKKHAQK